MQLVLTDTPFIPRLTVCQHIFLAGLAGQHPLRGPNVDEFGTRFPALSDAYDLSLRRCVHTAWREITKSKDRRLHEGVYAYVSGPRYETPFMLAIGTNTTAATRHVLSAACCDSSARMWSACQQCQRSLWPDTPVCVY